MHETVTVNGVSRTWELRHRITGGKLTEGAVMETRKGRPVKLRGAILPCEAFPHGQVAVEHLTSNQGVFAGDIGRYSPHQIGAEWVECSFSSSVLDLSTDALAHAHWFRVQRDMCEPGSIAYRTLDRALHNYRNDTNGFRDMPLSECARPALPYPTDS